MSNYTIGILKSMIAAGVKDKPADCPAELWEEANIKDASFEVTEGPKEVAVVTPASSFPSSYSWDSFGQGSCPISVDFMMKNKSSSFMVNKKEILKAPFRAKFLFGESKLKRSIKLTQNGQTQYFSTYGSGICQSNGQPWQQVVAQVKALDPKAYEYESGDICFELIDPIKDVEGNIVADAGTRIGYTTSSTNKSELVKFKNACIEKGLNLANAEVNVKVGFKLMSNQSNQNWSIITLDII